MRLTKFLKRQVSKVLCAALILSSVAVIGEARLAQAISKNEIEANGTVLTLNEPTTGALEEVDEQDWYIFEITERGYFSVDLQINADADTDLIRGGWTYSVYHAEDWVNPISTISGITTNGEGKGRELPLAEGRYYICVNPANSYSQPVGCLYNVKVNFTETEEWELEDNDSNAEANVIEANKTYYGNFHDYDDADWYQVTTPGDGTIQLDFGPDASTDSAEIQGGWSISILDASAKTITEYTTNTKLVSQFLPFKQGTFYIKVAPANSYRQPLKCIYDLRLNFTETENWELEDNDSNTEANVIEANKTYYGNFHDYDDVDWYQVTTPGNGTIQLDFGPDASTDSEEIQGGWSISILDANAKTITEYTTNTKLVPQYLPFKQGTFYVKVAPANSYRQPLNCIYNLKLNFSETGDWEKEYNNESTNATHITSGKEYHGVLSWGDDVDWYRIDNKEDVDVTLQFRVDGSTSIDDISYGWTIEVYNEVEKSVLKGEAADNLSGITRTTTQKDIRLAKGISYVKVACAYHYYDYQPIDCLYHLTVTATPVTGAGSDTSPSAEPTAAPDVSPSVEPTAAPDVSPSAEPTATPDVSPSIRPTATPDISIDPTAKPNNTSKPGNTVKPAATSSPNSASNEQIKKVIITSTVTTSTVTSKKKRSVYLRWKKQKYAGGYEIYRGTGKKKGYKKVKTIKGGSKVSWTDKKVKGGKTYYYKIRAYRKIGGKKSVSGFSKVKRVKVKK